MIAIRTILAGIARDRTDGDQSANWAGKRIHEKAFFVHTSPRSSAVIRCNCPIGRVAHVGNTHNSAIFVDRAVLVVKGANRGFRTLHVNTQASAGWRTAEHRGTIDCEARTLRYAGVVITKVDGRREALSSAIAKAVPFPSKGVMHSFATSVCARKLGPAVGDPDAWTRKYFKPG